jgi:hypothetical protein
VSTPPKPIPDVQKVLGASAIKRVLLVEGPDDKAIYAKWLERLAHPGLFSATVEVLDGGGKGEGGGKSVVLKALEWLRDHGGNPIRVFGLVDRDEWDATMIQQQVNQLPQLRVCPDRHAIESFFCDPNEFIPALTAHNAAWAAAGGLIRNHIAHQLANYVDHRALLTTTDRVKNRLLEQGYPGHFANTIPIPADLDIQQRFQQWAGVIDPAAAFQEFDQLRNAAKASNAQMQCRSHVWAKLFFEQVVLPAPNGLQSLQNKSVRDWMVDLAEWAPQVPADISRVLQPLLV